jgi:hypothetical protein
MADTFGEPVLSDNAGSSEPRRGVREYRENSGAVCVGPTPNPTAIRLGGTITPSRIVSAKYGIE